MNGCGLSNKEYCESVLAIHFIVGSASAFVHQRKDGTPQSRHTYSIEFERRAEFNFTVRKLA